MNDSLRPTFPESRKSSWESTNEWVKFPKI